MNQEEEYTSNEILSLTQLTKEEFAQLISSEITHAKKYQEYAMKEFQYRVKSYRELNSFINELRAKAN